MPLHRHATGLDRLTGVGFLLSLGLWAAGVTLPVLHVTELFMFQNDVSLVGIVQGLFEQGETAIGILVLVFTLILPPAKLVIGYGLWRFTEGSGIAARRGIAFLDAIGKWTMLDVLVLAVVVVTLKSSWVADVQTAPGLYFFAGSALLAVAAGLGLRRAYRGQSEKAA
ncbi:MAG: paraquat-inducible protein A [Alphaproteobacteria bacterium]|nr:paraquat-inducible protein A [Alphaproteobacteria bacterium]